MAKRSRSFFSDVVKAGAVCLWGLLIFDVGIRGQSADNLFLKTIFPAGTYACNQEGHVLSNVSSMLQSWLFPAASYVQTHVSIQTNGHELYPSQADLEAFSEENSQYEALEAEAEQKLAEMNGGGSETAVAAQTGALTPGIVYPRESLMDYQFLVNNFYVIDSSTSLDRSVLQPEVLVDKDLTMDLTGDEPKILLYHTHSQESFIDSIPGDEYGTTLGLGDTLTNILQDKYGVAVYHDRTTYDIIDGQIDRSMAYSMALPVIQQILEDNPSIKVVIDLHRDGVNENTHLVTTVNGKPTAKIMFFNGLCRNANGVNDYYQNPYLTENLAFSLQMQLKADEKYPDFTRRIYLRSYRYNMHLMPRTLLIECGAQTNTVEEVQNAMEPLADVLYSVLSGT